MTAPASKPFLDSWGSLVTGGVAGAGAGVAARLLKNLVDVGRRSPTESVIGNSELQAPVAQIPLEVTPAEAAELAKRGIKVKKVLRKAAALEGVLRPMAIGAGTAAAGLAGWTLADKLIAAARRRAAQSDVDRVRNRLEAVLDANPDSEDPVAKIAAACETDYFKTAADAPVGVGGFLGELAGRVGSMAGNTLVSGAERIIEAVPGPLAAVFGAGAGLTGLAAFQKAKSEAKSLAKAKALKKYLENRAEVAPLAAMDPYVVMQRTSEKSIENQVPGLHRVEA